jgi:hypothetical protein
MSGVQSPPVPPASPATPAQPLPPGLVAAAEGTAIAVPERLRGLSRPVAIPGTVVASTDPSLTRVRTGAGEIVLRLPEPPPADKPVTVQLSPGQPPRAVVFVAAPPPVPAPLPAPSPLPAPVVPPAMTGGAPAQPTAPPPPPVAAPNGPAPPPRIIAPPPDQPSVVVTPTRPAPAPPAAAPTLPPLTPGTVIPAQVIAATPLAGLIAGAAGLPLPGTTPPQRSQSLSEPGVLARLIERLFAEFDSAPALAEGDAMPSPALPAKPGEVPPTRTDGALPRLPAGVPAQATPPQPGTGTGTDPEATGAPSAPAAPQANRVVAPAQSPAPSGALPSLPPAGEPAARAPVAPPASNERAAPAASPPVAGEGSIPAMPVLAAEAGKTPPPPPAPAPSPASPASPPNGPMTASPGTLGATPPREAPVAASAPASAPDVEPSLERRPAPHPLPRMPVPPVLVQGESIAVRIVHVDPPGSAMPTPSPALSLAAGGGEPVLLGVVAGTTAQGHPVLVTASGSLVLSTRSEVPKGTVVTAVLTPDLPPPLDPDPLPPDAIKTMTEGSGWPEMRALLGTLAGANRAVAAQVANTLLPQPNRKLGAALTFLLGALRGGDARGWLGAEATDALEKAGRGDTIARFEREFTALRREAEDSVAGEWKAYPLPMLDSSGIQPARLYVRAVDDEERARRERGEGKRSRFLLDVTLTRLGPLQLDGSVRARRFDLVLRSQAPLPEGLRGELVRVFTDSVTAVGFTGALSFQAGSRAWVSPAAAPDGGRGVTA